MNQEYISTKIFQQNGNIGEYLPRFEGNEIERFKRELRVRIELTTSSLQERRSAAELPKRGSGGVTRLHSFQLMRLVSYHLLYPAGKRPAS